MKGAISVLQYRLWCNYLKRTIRELGLSCFLYRNVKIRRSWEFHRCTNRAQGRLFQISAIYPCLSLHVPLFEQSDNQQQKSQTQRRCSNKRFSAANRLLCGEDLLEAPDSMPWQTNQFLREQLCH